MLKKRIIIIINASKKLSKNATSTLSEIDKLTDFILIKHLTRFEKDATLFLIENLMDNDYVLSVGGDGTTNEVVNGILKSKKNDIHLGIIPSGTGNDFLKVFTKFDINRFVSRIISNEYQLIDTGYILIDRKKTHFINIADIGLGGKVVEIMNKQRRMNIGGKFSYVSAIIRGFFSFKKPIISINSDSFQYEGKVMVLAACNGSVFGHGLVINPFAKIQSGRLNFTLIGDVTLFDYIKNIGNLKRGKKIVDPRVYYFEGKEVHVKLVSGKVFGETDGELIEAKNCVIGIKPSSLKVINEINKE